MCKIIHVLGFLWGNRILFAFASHCFRDFPHAVGLTALHPPRSVGTTANMAEAEARRNNMLKEKCVVLEYKINRLGTQIISIHHINVLPLL